MPESVLQHLAERLATGSVPGAEGVQLAQIARPVKINLRGDASAPAFRRAVASAVGLEPPVAANTFVRAGATRCFWLGPDEWLIVASESAGDLAAHLRTELTDQHAAIVDVDAAYATLRLTGARAREVLAKACPLDFHPRAFRAGSCAQSNFARTQALVALEDEAPAFDLFIRRSFAAYVAEWLLDAMREYAA